MPLLARVADKDRGEVGIALGGEHRESVPERPHGQPGDPQAFLTRPGQGVNYHRGTWHGVLTPLSEPGVFAVVDRIGQGVNLEEHWLEEPYTIIQSKT